MLLLASKSPSEIKFYDFNWAAKRLAPGEVILSSGWEIEGGSVVIANSPAPSVNNGVTRVYVAGGVLDDIAYLTNYVETNLNPRRDFTGKLKVKPTTS